MAHQSFMRTVLETALAIAEKNGGEVTVKSVSYAMSARTPQQHKNVLNTLSDLFQQGRLQRLRKGVYSAVVSTGKPEKRKVMWQLLRMRKRVSIEDMMTMAEVSQDYAREWFRMLTEHGVVRKLQSLGKASVWVLVKDSIEMPTSDEKAAKLRALRARKKAELVNRLSKIENEIQLVKSEISEL